MPRKRGTLAEWVADAALPILVLDHRQRVRVFNRGASLTSGFAPGDILGRRCECVPDAQPGTPAAMLDAFAVSSSEYKGAPVTVDVVFTAKNLAVVERTALLIPLESEAGDSQLLVVLSTPKVENIAQAVALIPHATLRSAKSRHARAHAFDRFVASSPAMTQASRQIETVVQSRASVWISGRPGSGRTHVLEVILSISASNDGISATVDGRLLNEQQLEDILSSFFASNAPRYRLACESLAEWPAENQQSLAKYVCGSGRKVQLISTASSAEPETLIPELRQIAADVTIQLPRLRDRQDDISLLAQHFLESCKSDARRQSRGAGDDRRQPVSFSEAAISVLERYRWPGEIVELKRCVEEAVAASREEIIDVSDLPSSLRLGIDADRVVPTEPIRPLEDVLREVERNHVIAALESVSGEKARAAKLLGMSRPKLYRRIEELDISLDEDPA